MSKFGEAMRGLTVFISDIRNCKLEREREREREKEGERITEMLLVFPALVQGQPEYLLQFHELSWKNYTMSYYVLSNQRLHHHVCVM